MKQETIELLALEPDGGNYYQPHPFMVHSGQFWRCRHGGPPLDGCALCALSNPIGWLRWHGWLK